MCQSRSLAFVLVLLESVRIFQNVLDKLIEMFSEVKFFFLIVFELLLDFSGGVA